MFDNVKDKVFQRVAKAAGVPLYEVRYDSVLAALGIDSISVVEIVLDLEEDLNSDIDDGFVGDGVIATVGQLVDYVAAAMTAKAAGRSVS